MSTTILYGTRPPREVAATADGNDLWLAPPDLAAAPGWELKPEGLCQADRCVRIPQGRSVSDGQRVNLAAFAALLEQPVLRDRSEEHTSELQSHSFISYAVFC